MEDQQLDMDRSQSAPRQVGSLWAGRKRAEVYVSVFDLRFHVGLRHVHRYGVLISIAFNSS